MRFKIMMECVSDMCFELLGLRSIDLSCCIGGLSSGEILPIGPVSVGHTSPDPHNSPQPNN
jgi:hypothetical protein